MFAIFSYNRGQFLTNCVQSIIENCSEIHYDNIVIFDDDSDELTTKNILEKLRTNFQVVVNEEKNFNISRRGLYHNMNKALQMAIERDFEYVFFLQEDLQIVRPVDSEFLQHCDSIFAYDENIVQIQPVFFKSTTPDTKYRQFITINEDCKFYAGNENNTLGIADIGLIKLKLLKEQQWQFDHEETLNMKKGQQLGWYYVKPANPIMMYLPWPTTYRFKKAGDSQWFIRYLDRLYGTGFHPYKTMTDIQALINRPIAAFPYGESFLQIKSGQSLKQPWNFVSTKFYFLKNFFNIMKKLKLFWLVKLYYQNKMRKQLRTKEGDCKH